MPKNFYLRRIAHVQTVKDEILQAWTAQLCMDVMTIVLNDELHLGHDRLTRVGAKVSYICQEPNASGPRATRNWRDS